MGVSTNAILFYGIAYDDDVEMPWEDEIMDPEDFYARARGAKIPTVEYEMDKRAHERFWDERRKLMRASGVEIGRHCSDRYPMLYLATRETEITAYRGFPKTVDPKGLVPPKDADKKLKDFCETMGLPYRQPEWTLVSYWG